MSFFMNSTSVLFSLAFSLARLNAFSLISTPVILKSLLLFLSDIAIHPEPVHRSSILSFLPFIFFYFLSTSNSVSNLGINALSSTFIIAP